MQEARGAGWLLQRSPGCYQAMLRLGTPASCTIVCRALGFVVRQKAREREMGCGALRRSNDTQPGQRALGLPPGDEGPSAMGPAAQ